MGDDGFGGLGAYGRSLPFGEVFFHPLFLLFHGVHFWWLRSRILHFLRHRLFPQPRPRNIRLTTHQTELVRSMRQRRLHSRLRRPYGERALHVAGVLVAVGAAEASLGDGEGAVALLKDHLDIAGLAERARILRW